MFYKHLKCLHRMMVKAIRSQKYDRDPTTTMHEESEDEDLVRVRKRPRDFQKYKSKIIEKADLQMYLEDVFSATMMSNYSNDVIAKTV